MQQDVMAALKAHTLKCGVGIWLAFLLCFATFLACYRRVLCDVGDLVLSVSNVNIIGGTGGAASRRLVHVPQGLGVLRKLEAECCSLDSLGAFTDEHYCGPAVTRSMHSDDTHSQMWV
jgi:hypothetical protein